MTENSYAAAGVDVEAGERAVALMRASVMATKRPEVVGDFGGFAGLFDISNYRHMQRPILATSTDGVGTKIAVARAMDVHHTIGLDLVAMVIDDLVVVGAEPLFLTDYIATGSVHPERIAAIVQGIAQGCEIAGCTLIGGETAEHPGLMAPDEYDIAGAGTGIVDGAHILGPERVQPGDVVVAMAASGLHSNGYSLARHVLLKEHSVTDQLPECGRTIGEELLEPTRIYAKVCVELARAQRVHAFSHITGGGIAANIARVLPATMAADIERSSWSPLPVFRAISERGNVSQGDMERTFNMGLGMVAICPPDYAQDVIRASESAGIPAWVCGVVRLRNDGEQGDADAKGGKGGAVFVQGTYA